MNVKDLHCLYFFIFFSLTSIANQPTNNCATLPTSPKKTVVDSPPLPNPKKYHQRRSKYQATQEKNNKKKPRPSTTTDQKKITTTSHSNGLVNIPKTELPKKRTIILKNALTKDMITYNHWSGKHTPEFTITVNGKKINEESTEKIEILNDKAEISYAYNFANGYYKGSKKVDVEIPSNASTLAIDFSWNKQPNLSLVVVEDKKETPSKKEDVSFNAKNRSNILLKE